MSSIWSNEKHPRKQYPVEASLPIDVPLLDVLDNLKDVGHQVAESTLGHFPGDFTQAQLSVQDEQLRYGFDVAGWQFLIARGCRSEVLKSASIAPLPSTPKWFKGLINLRGNLVPIYDLLPLLKAVETDSWTGYLLILGSGDEMVGVCLNQFPMTCALHEAQYLQNLPSLPSVLREAVQQAYLLADQYWLELDHQQLFSRLLVDC